MEHSQQVIERKTRTGLFGTETRREEKWILRLFIALLACAIAVSVLHAIGQVMFIVHMCA